MRGCGSSTTKKRERQRKRELVKSASTTKSIVDMFSAQSNKTPSTSSPTVPPSKSSKEKVKETRQKLQTQAVQELGDLLRLKTVQMNRYGHVLDHKSNLYLRHQMVQSFLWMQLNKEKDNPGLDQQGLAQIVAQSFNRRAYTKRKIIEWEKCWMKTRKIPSTNAGKHLHNV